MVHGIAVLSIALLLGSSSAVRIGEMPCYEILKITRQLYGFNLGVRSPIEYSNFDNPIDFSYTRLEKYNNNEDNAFVVMQTDQSLPQITVGGKSYKLYAFVFRLIDFYDGVANLIVIFSVNGNYMPDQSAALFIPLSLLSDTDEADLNEQLNGDLSAFSKLPPGRTHTVTSVQWLKPLMETATLVTRPGPGSKIPSRYTFELDVGTYALPDVSYLIDCKIVSQDSVKAFT